MPEASHRLGEVPELLRRVKINDAEQICREVITAASDVELRQLEPLLRQTIALFLRKRQDRLSALLDKALASSRTEIADGRSSGAAHIALRDPSDPAELRTELETTLADLEQHHIFQWSTHYRDKLAPLFEALVIGELDLLTRAGGDTVAPDVRALLANHSYMIAGQGYHYTIRTGQENRAVAISKTLAGLQRFLELPIEFYSALFGSVTTPDGAVALRRICSAFIAGIVEGYGSARFDGEEGWPVLARVPRTWAHYAGWLTASDLASLCSNLETSTFADGLTTIVGPVTRAIDDLVQERPLGCTVLPVLGQLDAETLRLTISLEGSRSAGSRLVEIQCYFDSSTVQLGALEEAAGRHVALVVARLRPDVGDWVESRDHFRQLVLNTGAPDSDPVRLAKRANDILRLVIATEFGAAGTDAPLNYNFARDFPLQNPFVRHYFHVVRQTVNALLGRFDRRNGARLWCSLRRSGKTTACFDLGTTTGRSTVVSQTCERTAQEPDADLFYRMVLDALNAGQQLPDTFFSHVVNQCSPPRRPNEIRFVFLLDEYETLFERLRLAVDRNAELRYTVVQPLLNQMVAFTRDNLLILIGQRPDAHFVFMDQNQLSAYVEQDSFPLFEHKAGWSEFHELLRKIASERVPFENEFADAVYAETAGHPFLTAKVMIDFFDWMIEQRRSMRGLQLTASDFEAFRDAWLSPRRLGTAQEYQFFSHAIAEALSAVGRERTPWLNAIYTILRQLAVDYPATFRCSRDEFTALVERLGIAAEHGYSADQLLGGGTQANFFGFTATQAWVRIPLLARIAATTRPKVSW